MGSFLWPIFVKRPIAVPNQIIWTRRKKTSVSVTQDKTLKVLEPYSIQFMIWFTTCQDPVKTCSDSRMTNHSLLELTLPVYGWTLILHPTHYYEENKDGFIKITMTLYFVKSLEPLLAEKSPLLQLNWKEKHFINLSETLEEPNQVFIISLIFIIFCGRSHD